MRDEFTQPIKETLAKRVGFRCSNPGCLKWTSGPHEEPTKAVNIGVAAHIKAAAPGGKRYDSTLSPTERKSIENGIWLCQNCGKLVDSDEQKYPVSLLLDWKQQAERRARSAIENGVSQVSPNHSYSRFEKYLSELIDEPQSRWLHEINESTWYEFQLFTKIKQGDSEQPESTPNEISKPILEVIRDDTHSAIFITGAVGAGKSTLLSKLAVNAARQALQNIDAPIPILVRLKDYKLTGESAGIRGLILNNLECYDPSLDDEARDHLLKTQKVLLLIDGWDELSDDKEKSKIKTFCKPHLVIVAGRNAGEYWEIKQKFEIQPLSSRDVRQFFDARLPNAERKQLEALTDRVKDFGQTPLMVWMLYSIFKTTNSTPETRGEAYYAFTNIYEQRAKEGIDFSEVRSLLGQLAFSMMQSRRLKDPTDWSRDISEIDARGLFSETQLKKIRNHLLIWKGERNPKISFCHQSLQEYYAAEHLLAQLKQNPGWLEKEDGQNYTHFQKEYLNYLKWTEPIALMLGLVSDEAIALNIVGQALDVDWRLGARLSGEVNPDFQVQTVKFVEELEVPDWLKVQLLGLTKSVEAISSLEKKIRHPDFLVRWDTVTALHQINHQISVPILLDASKDSAYFVRLAVIAALGSLGGGTAIEVLLEILDKADYDDFYLKSAYELAKLGHDEGFFRLEKALNHQNKLVIRKAFLALKNLNNEAANSILIEALEHPNNYVCKLAIQALGELRVNTSIPHLLNVLKSRHAYLSEIDDLGENIVNALATIGGDQAISALLRIANHQNLLIQKQAIKTLGFLRCKESIPILLNALQDKNQVILVAVIRALGLIGNDLVSQKLFQLFETSDDYIREHIIKALDEIGSAETISKLIPFLTDSNYCIRLSVSDLIKKHGRREAISMLLDLMDHQHSEVRQIATQALGLIGDKSVISKISNALNDSEELVKIDAAVALMRLRCCLGNLVLVHKLETLSPHSIFWGYFSFDLPQLLETEEAIPVLLKALENSDREIRYAGASTLDKILCEVKELENGLVPFIFKIFEKEDNYTYNIAISMLDKIENWKDISKILKALKYRYSGTKIKDLILLIEKDFRSVIPLLLDTLNSEDPLVRSDAVSALNSLGDDSIVTSLIDMLCSEENKAQREILLILESVGNAKAVKALKQLEITASSSEVPEISRTIASIQNRCQFYNYEIWQAHPEGQKGDWHESQNRDPGTTIHVAGDYISGDKIQGDKIEGNKTESQFPNATTVKIFENVKTYHEAPPRDPPP